MRCFIAIDLPQAVKNELTQIQRLFRERELIIGKFVEPENLHLTLKFLGDCDAFVFEQVEQMLATVQYERFELTLGTLGFFTPYQPRVLWASLEGAGVLGLFNAIETVLEPWFDREQKPFVSHVTLARIQRVNSEQFECVVKQHKLQNMTFMVEQFILKQSQLTSQGPIYTDRACYPLESSNQ